MPKKKSSAKKSKGDELKESAHSVWLAGLGGLALAEEEGGKLFNTLVERGKALEERLAAPVTKAGRSLKGRVGVVSRKAGRRLKTIETAIDEQVASAIGRLGVPTRDEIARLTRRVEELTASLDAMHRGAPKSAGRSSAGARTTKSAAASPKVASKKSPTRRKKAGGA